MNKTAAKKLACQYAAVALKQLGATSFLSVADEKRLNKAKKDLVAELERRAGELSKTPLLDISDDAALAAINGTITIDGTEKTVIINDIGDSFIKTERLSEFLIEMEERDGFAIVFKEAKDEE